jgi:Fe-S-cluster containining protein
MSEAKSTFGFPRTECACEECTMNCYFIPGYLITSDLEVIAKHLGYDDLFIFAMENLLASPGATVSIKGQLFQIMTLVPKRRPDGACQYLTCDSRCSIYSVAPYACSHFDMHQSKQEADLRSRHGLQAIAHEWAVGGLYARIWMALYAAGLIAPSPAVSRALMHAACSRNVRQVRTPHS